MTKRNTDELAELIKARLEKASEEGEELTPEDVILEFGLSDEETTKFSEMAAGVTLNGVTIPWYCFVNWPWMGTAPCPAPSLKVSLS